MTIEAINAQLLRAIGVGVVLIDIESRRTFFENDTFAEWFGASEGGRPLADAFPDLDPAAMLKDLQSGKRHDIEATFRVRRRSMTVAVTFSLATETDRQIVVAVCQNITRIKELEAMIDSYSLMVERNTREIRREKERVEQLLLNIMPRSAYDEFKSLGIVSPRRYDPVTVLSLDFSDFSRTVLENDASVVVSELNDIYSAFDRIGEQFGCERIKTLGNAYIAVSGMGDTSANHASAAASAAVRFLRYLRRRNETHPIRWKCRVALSTGMVVGSVVGVRKYIYDVFGPAVDEAERLMSFARPETIVANEPFAEAFGERQGLRRIGVMDVGGGRSMAVFEVSEPEAVAAEADL
ncbi:adenylate/guanylate cyclase domain-containing protein [Chelativorans intermedius]|uniref:Adenylate/guanylate cyclase domain-containing protein n=1 Tax=Chelativorans intermedius TaxID=515947 RepID=A0ABV6D2P4_9HYPH|nr:adenylate/guanylate cyclase domain-containing protein [Chelativorans intermedius]MCT8997295.1 adenylate/guanylate cyclase domain-containing protein [Chelativorans intermedius]